MGRPSTFDAFDAFWHFGLWAFGVAFGWILLYGAVKHGVLNALRKHAREQARKNRS